MRGRAQTIESNTAATDPIPLECRGSTTETATAKEPPMNSHGNEPAHRRAHIDILRSIVRKVDANPVVIDAKQHADVPTGIRIGTAMAVHDNFMAFWEHTEKRVLIVSADQIHGERGPGMYAIHVRASDDVRIFRIHLN
jgi:hypothetical protein